MIIRKRAERGESGWSKEIKGRAKKFERDKTKSDGGRSEKELPRTEIVRAIGITASDYK